MPRLTQSRKDLLQEIETLRIRLHEAEDVLKAIRDGKVDAIVIHQDQGEQVALILEPNLSQNAKPYSQSTTPYVTRSVPLGTVDRIVQDSQERIYDSTQTLYLGESKPALRVKKLVDAAAQNDSTVLLQGETGTGKSIIARWLYKHSPRASRPFVEINCASLHGDLLANELFGHVRGAFTSATDAKEGLLDVVNGGTLFLDEIGDLDLKVQSQFLKVLEEKHYRRLGDTKERQSEFRLFCATNRNLIDEIDKNCFRKDLYYRINIFPIGIPPLRDRPEDVPRFATKILRALGSGQTEIDPIAMRRLTEYNWPGNIRELRNVLERALLLANGDLLTSEHFPGIASLQGTDGHGAVDIHEIQAAITRFKGNKKKAAEYLGISRITLYRKLKNTPL